MANSFLVNGSAIQMLRKKSGLTQAELSSKIMGLGSNISTRTLQRIENDNNYKCSRYLINNFKKFFEVSADELLSKENLSSEDIKEEGGEDEKLLLANKRAEELSDRHQELFEQNLDLAIEEEKKLKERLKKEMSLKKTEYISREFILDEDFFKLLIDEVKKNKNVFKDIVISKMREFKFIPTTFSDLAKATSDQVSYKMLLKAENNLIIRRLFEEVHHYDPWDFENDHDLIRMSLKESLFEKLSKAQYFSIDSDLPDDEETLEIVCGIVDKIEDYLSEPRSISDELRFKFYLSKLIDKLESKKMSIFSKSFKETRTGFNENIEQKTFEAQHLRILIKSWKNQSVKTRDYCMDSYGSDSPKNYIRVKWRDYKVIDRQTIFSKFLNQARRVHGDKYDYYKTKYKNSKTSINIFCKKHGEFSMMPDTHLKGKGCPQCSEFRKQIMSKKYN